MPVALVVRSMPTRRFAPVGPSWYEIAKPVLDFAAALVLLILAAPLLAIIGFLVKLTSRGPVFYAQLRLGKDGQPFLIHKVRTMFHECESISGPRWATADDPRVTLLGNLLRRTHLDELPQLWNVLCGDMSLIGPRPERPEFIPRLAAALPGYGDRLMVKPGVSGLAQVRLPADSNLESVRRKLAYDRYYVRRIGPWLDLQLMLCTAGQMVGIPFVWSCRVLRVPGHERVGLRVQEASRETVALSQVA